MSPERKVAIVYAAFKYELKRSGKLLDGKPLDFEVMAKEIGEGVTEEEIKLLYASALTAILNDMIWSCGKK